MTKTLHTFKYGHFQVSALWRASEYAGKLAPERAAAVIAQGVGRSGANPEYLENTVRRLDALGITDGPLHRVQALVRQMADR